jgi:hypothetical protein
MAEYKMMNIKIKLRNHNEANKNKEALDMTL